MLNLELINYGNRVEENISINSYISSPIESLRYSKYIDDRSIALEYIDSEEVNSKENLAIQDLSWKMPKNNINFFNENEEFEINGGSFYSEYKDLLLTNKVTLDIHNKEIPLYYRHYRKVKEASIHCVKQGDNFTVESGFLIDENTLYTNYNNFFEEETGKYILYFVSGVDTEGNSFNELLNLVPAIKEASWEDIDLDSGEVSYDNYVRNVEGNGYRYELYLDLKNCNKKNISEKIFAKGLEKNLIKILPPEAYSLKSDWILRIQNGAVVQDGILYKLPEYNKQAFNPIYGVIYFIDKLCEKVNSNVIKINANEIIVKPELYMNVEIFIHDEEENLIKAVTTNKNLVDTIAKENIKYEFGVASWDESKAFIELDFSLLDSQIITCNYYYKADSFLIKEINVNPFFNEKIIYNKYFFYIKPFRPGALKSLEWLILDEDDRIVECSQEDLKVEVANDFNASTVIGKSLNLFVEQYCYGGGNDYKYMELGEVFLEEDAFLDEVTHFDIREKTSVKKENYEPMILRQWKILQSRFGYGELGQVVQKNGIIYIEAPYSLLSEFTEEEVERMLRKQIPATLEVIIEYIYPKSNISFDLTTQGEVTLNLSWEEPGVYRIYRSQTKIKRDESVLIAEISSTLEEVLTYVDTEVASNNNYYYWVRINDNPYNDTHGVKIR